MAATHPSFQTSTAPMAGFRGALTLIRRLLGLLWRRDRAIQSTVAHLRHVEGLAARAENLTPLPPSPTTPLVSFIVPVFNAKPSYLDDLLASYRKQPRNYCELILSDDGSNSPQTRTWLARHSSDKDIVVLRSEENRGIAAATNAGISRATGRFVGLLDHDDALTAFAVSRVARALSAAPNCRFLYTDEVIADADLRPVDYFLKPAWDPVLLSGVNYINHLSLYRRDRLIEIGGMRDGFQGSQDYDLVLRYTAMLRADEILHLPYPAYLWRRPNTSFSANFLNTATLNARRSLAEHFGHGARPVSVDPAISPDLHRVRFDTSRTDWPLISVVIPSRDAWELISRILADLSQATDYPALEIIVVDNGSKDPRVLALYESYRKDSCLRSGITFTATIEEAPFNFSAAVNRGFAQAKGAYVLLLNNDIEIVEPNWLKEMLSCFEYPNVGVVGAKLLYPDYSIQHIGVIVGLGRLAGHWYGRRDAGFPGPMARLHVRQSLSAVTGACMLISRTCLESTGAFDESIFGIAYNDVDFCLRAIEAGFRIVVTPFATLLHHESASRGSDETAQNIARFRRDQDNLRQRHKTDVFEDRALNPWYSKHHSEPSPVALRALPDPR